MKLAVIGGGSSYTPELLSGLLSNAEEAGIREVALFDPDEQRVATVAGFCRRMAKGATAPLAISATVDVDQALQGAHFVVFQLRVGGQQARHEDIMMAWRHDLIGQETTGVGGFAKALRTVPVVLGYAERIAELCPDAWVINFTNPAGLVTEALCSHTALKCVGLCNVPIEAQIRIADWLQRPRQEVALDWVGLNHLGWLRAVRAGGQDVLPELIDRIESGAMDATDLLDVTYPPGFLRQLGSLPSPYLRFFYLPTIVLEEARAAGQTRAEEVMAIEEELFAAYRDEAVSELPAALQQRGGAWYSRLAVDVIGALQRDAATVHIVNAPSGGAIGEMPDDAVIEVPCEISRHGVVPLDQGAVDPMMIGLMQQVKAYERLTIDAAMHRDRDTALRALMAHPLVPNVTQARAVLSDLVDRRHL